MFEAFTPEAADAVLEAAETARRLLDDTIRSQHLLAGALVAGKGHPSVQVCHAAGVTAVAVLGTLRDGLGPDAARDVAALGIDLVAVQTKIEASFGPDALRGGGRRWPRIPFSPRAKAAINQTVDEAQASGRDLVEIADVLSAVLHPGLTDDEQALLGSSYAEMAAEEGLYDGEKRARQIVRSLGADPDELRARIRGLP